MVDVRLTRDAVFFGINTYFEVRKISIAPSDTATINLLAVRNITKPLFAHQFLEVLKINFRDHNKGTSRVQNGLISVEVESLIS